MRQQSQRARSGWVGATAGATVLLLALSACSSADAPAASTPRTGGELTVASSTDLTTLDPSKGSANAMALTGYAIYDTLMIVPRLGDAPKPNIAKSLTASADGMTWTMKLPSGVKFSDGSPFDAAAVKYNLDRGMAKGSTAAALLSSISSVSAPDDQTVLISMNKPFPNLPYVFCYDGSGTAGYVASPTALQQYGDQYTQHAAGIGPYMLQSWSPGQPVTLVRNPNYWDTTNHKPYLDKVTIRTISDPQTAYQAVQSGQVDLMATVSPPLMQTATQNTQVKTVRGVGQDQDAIILNVASAPFNDLRLRKAVSMALNRDDLVTLTTNGMGKPAVNLFPSGDVRNSNAADPAFDLTKAKQFVMDYESSTGQKAKFTYSCNNTRSANDAIVQQLKAAGFDVTLDAPDYRTWVSNFFGKKYTAICWTMAGFLTPDLLPYRFLSSTGDLNTDGFNSSDFDTAANNARNSTDSATQIANWKKADEVLTQQLPWVWVTSAPIGFIAGSRVHGADYDDPARLRYSVPTLNSVWVSH